MAEGNYSHPVVMNSSEITTGEVQAGAGGQIDVPFTIPQGMIPVMAVARETTSANLFPVWICYIDRNNSIVRVKYANFRTSAYTGKVSVAVLCM